MNGILLVDKPQGITSQTLVTKVKHILGIKKIGHVGTLDPLATGLMVLLLGEATKLADYLISDDKSYLARISLGKSTTTEDATGEVKEQVKVALNLEVDHVLTSLNGVLSQIPPMHSSVHHQGKKLYQYAHQGLEVSRQPREVYIYDLQRSSPLYYENDEAEFSFLTKVSKGTYIRTLCVEIGSRLNYPAHMKELRRLASGKWHISQAHTLQDLEKGNFKIIPMLEAMGDYDLYEASDAELIDVLNGKPLYLPKLKSAAQIIIISHNNQLRGIYEKNNDNYKARRVWN